MEHKHKGVERESGSLRSHPIERQHKDEKVKKEHNNVLTSKQSKYFQPTKNKSLLKKLMKNSVEVTPKKQSAVNIPVDNEGYLSIDLDKADITGIRLSFTRIEGRTKKTIGLQIENKE